MPKTRFNILSFVLKYLSNIESETAVYLLIKSYTFSNNVPIIIIEIISDSIGKDNVNIYKINIRQIKKKHDVNKITLNANY